MNIGQRLRLSRKRNDLTLDEAGSKAGISRQTLHKYETGIISNIPSDKIERLAEVYDVSPAYIMGWQKLEKQREKGVKIPVLGRVAAGIPIEAVEDIEDYEEITETMASSGEYFALRIHGKSMEPRILDGDVVIVRKQEDIESGEIGVVIVNGSDATVKKVMKEEKGIMLVATNQSVYSPKFYDKKAIKDLPIYILGRVVELRAKL